MTTEVIDTIVTNCCISLSLNYGVASARMFERMLVNKENSERRKLSVDEVSNLYNEFDAELCRTVFTRGGK